MSDAFRVSINHFISKDEVLDILNEASIASGFNKFQMFTKDNVMVKETVVFFGKLSLTDDIRDFRIKNLEITENIGAFTGYYLDDPLEMGEFFSTLNMFIRQLKKKFNLNFDRKSLIRDRENLMIAYDVYKKVKSKFPNTTYNHSESVMYIEEYDINVYVQTGMRIGGKIVVEISNDEDGIDIRGNRKDLKQSLINGELIKSLESVLLSSMFLNIVSGPEHDLIDGVFLQSYTVENVAELRAKDDVYRKLVLKEIKKQLQDLGYNPAAVLSCHTVFSPYSSCIYFKYRDLFFGYRLITGGFVHSKNELDVINFFRKSHGLKKIVY